MALLLIRTLSNIQHSERLVKDSRRLMWVEAEAIQLLVPSTDLTRGVRWRY